MSDLDACADARPTRRHERLHEHNEGSLRDSWTGKARKSKAWTEAALLGSCVVAYRVTACIGNKARSGTLVLYYDGQSPSYRKRLSES